MTKIIDAIYENGVFKPLEKTALAEGQHVKLFITSSPAPGKASTLSAVISEMLQEGYRVYLLAHQVSSESIEHLIDDPSFRIPSAEYEGFDSIEPIKGAGTAASSLLLEDRR